MSSGNDYPERLPEQPTVDQALDALKYDADGLVTVVAQDAAGGEVLMVAYANREALAKSLETGRMHYYSRSRKKLWMKGEDSGHTQELVALIADCDGDALVAKVRQVKGACHRGTQSCFAFEIRRAGGVAFIGQRVFDPKDVYRKHS